MKTRFTFLSITIFLFYISNCYSQVIDSCSNYSLGISQYIRVSDNQMITNTGILNSTGSNLTWNLNDTIFSFMGTATQQILPSDQVSGFNYFPQSNIVRKMTNASNEFLVQDSNGIKLVGRYPSNLPEIELYSNPKSIIHYPLSFNDCQVDSYVIDSVYDSWTMSWIYSTGKIQTCFDATGEVVFPTGSVLQCYKISLFDTMQYIYDGTLGFNYRFKQYWFDSNCEILSPIMFAEGNLSNGGLKYYINVYILKDLILGLEVDRFSSNGIFLCPNPANEIITINGSYDKSTVTITNATGNFISKTTLDKNNQINISHLKVGLYFVLLQNDDEIITRKFIKH